MDFRLGSGELRLRSGELRPGDFGVQTSGLSSEPAEIRLGSESDLRSEFEAQLRSGDFRVQIWNFRVQIWNFRVQI